MLWCNNFECRWLNKAKEKTAPDGGTFYVCECPEPILDTNGLEFKCLSQEVPIWDEVNVVK